jgi:chaperone modulatory protein CbpM
MPTEHLIPADKFCAYHHIEFSFIRNMQEFGLIEIKQVKDTSYIPEDQLEKAEQMIRLYNDLEINAEGIDTITHLLRRINRMQAEITVLKNKLRMYEDD